MARTPKLDAQLAAAVDEARAALLPLVPAGQLGEHLEAVAEGERVVTHRFAASVPGYRGWQWYVTVARASRAKNLTVCESGLLPGPDALLAPDWVPWSDRIDPTELAQEAAAAAGQVEGAEQPGEAKAGEGADPANEAEASQQTEPEAESGADQPAHERAEQSEAEQPDAEQGPADGHAAARDGADESPAEAAEDEEEDQPRTPRRRRRRRR